MRKRYFTLAVRDDGRWAPQFGDYDRSVVADELNDYVDSHDYRRKDLRILTTTDAQAAIDAAVAALNK
jgi:hypothetical protein